MSDPRFEYGVLHVGTERLHREGMTVEEAERWLADWLGMGGNPDTFAIIRRALGPWEKP